MQSTKFPYLRSVDTPLKSINMFTCHINFWSKYMINFCSSMMDMLWKKVEKIFLMNMVIPQVVSTKVLLDFITFQPMCFCPTSDIELNYKGNTNNDSAKQNLLFLRSNWLQKQQKNRAAQSTQAVEKKLLHLCRGGMTPHQRISWI